MIPGGSGFSASDPLQSGLFLLQNSLSFFLTSSMRRWEEKPNQTQ